MSDLFESTLDLICEEVNQHWSKEHAVKVKQFLEHKIEEYAKGLNLPKGKLLQAIEENRNYCAVNFYQECNFPKLSNVLIFSTRQDLWKKFSSGKYICPRCDHITTDPYECNSGALMENKKVCDWKSYGLFGTLGKGINVIVLDDFLLHPKIHHIFKPIELKDSESS